MKRSGLAAAGLFIAVLLHPLSAGAGDYTDGRIKLTLHEGQGRFSLYYLNDAPAPNVPPSYEPFFADRDPRTSFLTVRVNDKTYKLGDTASFRTRIAGSPANPAFIFESPFLQVTESFSFIKTASSAQVNGIKITVTVQNRNDKQVDAGLRLLLDTNLGEGPGREAFVTDTRSIHSETVSGSGERRWISENSRLSLMGSIEIEEGKNPDLVLFANWKRLNDVPWNISYVPERNFNYLPYSIGDSAVCYYFDPRPLPGDGEFSFSVCLAAADADGFTSSGTAYPKDYRKEITESPGAASSESPVSPASSRSSGEADFALLQELIDRIDAYLSGDIIITGEDLAGMEHTITRLKKRYGL
jgi:hypothetical protein